MHNQKKYLDIFLYLIVFVLIMNMAAANIMGGREIPFYIGLLLILSNFAANKINFNNKFFIIVFFWILINVISMIFNQVSYNLFRLLIETTNLLFLPYLLLTQFGNKFWIFFEKTLFGLTIISTILYGFNLLLPDTFSSFRPFFLPFTTLSLQVNPGYWSAFIYVFSFADNGYGIMRNNGFMWEPGGMAMMVIWAIVFNWLTTGVKFNVRFIIYSIALLTTFSTAGYISFAIILAAFFIRKINFINIIAILLILSFVFKFYSQLEFISGKLSVYNEAFENDMYGESGNIDNKVNRFQGGITALLRVAKNPLGTGLVSANDIGDYDYSYGVNGIASLLEMWGIPMFIFLMYQMYKYFYCLNRFKINSITIIFLFSAMMIPFFSNPITRFLLVYLIIFTPITGISFYPIKLNETLNINEK